jgi:glycosyltransferase involved in cell wall biosynthesis
MKVQASVVIPTRDRTEELRKLLRSALAQTIPLEILVMDDGTSDATAEMIHNEFPQVRYHRLASSRGPAYQRNRGIELASNDLVFPIDDDVLFSSPRTVEQTLAEFEHPRVGAVGIPFINVRDDQIVRQRPPEAKAIYVTHAFVGAAHAVRRDLFLKLGGFREHFFYMGEEGDFCIRMLGQGYVVRLGCADPIHHLESRRRNLSRAGFSGRRNDILFAWHNVPFSRLPIHLVGTTVNGIRTALTQGCFWSMLRGTWNGYVGCWKHRHEREQVSASTYRLYRRLKKEGPARLEDVERLLAPLRTK